MWLNNGVTEHTYGKRHPRTVRTRSYKCLNCGWSVRVELSEKPPRYCPNCGKDHKEDEQSIARIAEGISRRTNNDFRKTESD